MNAKANIQAVPTAADKLLSAQVEFAKLSAEDERIRDKINALAPIEAEVAQARAELGQVIAADEKSLREWVDAGAKGSTPANNTTAREAAVRKLAAAQGKLDAAQGVKGDLEQEWQAINNKAHPLASQIKMLAMDVVGEEAIRAATAYRDTVMAMLEAEAYYQGMGQRIEQFKEKAVTAAFFDEHGHLTSTPATASEALCSQWYARLRDATGIANEQRKDVQERAAQRVDTKVQQLLSAKEPTK